MIDPIITSLAAQVITVLTPFVAKGAEAFAASAGKATFEKAQSLFNTIKTKWAGDTASTIVLGEFEKAPATFEPTLKAILETKLAQDEDLAAELKKLLETMDLAPVIKIKQDMEKAKGVTGLEAKTMNKGEANVEQAIKEAENVTGAKFDTIG